MTITENIKNTIVSDISKITTDNGYSITIAEIKDGTTNLTETNNIPSAFVFVATDKIEQELEENEIRSVDVVIGVHCLNEDDDAVIESILKHFQQDESIIKDYQTSLENVDGIIQLNIVEKNYNINWHNNKKTIGILINIRYFQNTKNVSSSVNISTPPSILTNYTLTSTTEALQKQVNGLTGYSGIITANQTFTVTNGIITSVS